MCPINPDDLRLPAPNEPAPTQPPGQPELPALFGGVIPPLAGVIPVSTRLGALAVEYDRQWAECHRLAQLTGETPEAIAAIWQDEAARVPYPITAVEAVQIRAARELAEVVNPLIALLAPAMAELGDRVKAWLNSLSALSAAPDTGRGRGRPRPARRPPWKRQRYKRGHKK